MLLSHAQNAELDRLLRLLKDYATNSGYAGTAWLNPHLISRFIATNPTGLDATSLERVGQWRHAAAGPFFVMRHTETCSMFMNRLGTFAVRGTHEELRHLVPKTPTQVEVTLLPFDGHIVCAEDPRFAPEQLGEASRADIDDTYRSLDDKGVIYSAAAMMRAVRRASKADYASSSDWDRARTHLPAPSAGPAETPLAGECAEEEEDVPQGLAQIIAFKPRSSAAQA